MLTVVTGPPCAGKTSYVEEHAEPGDVVVDFDRLAQALGSQVTHDHPEHVAEVTRQLHTAAIGAAIARHRCGARVWIVQTYITPGSGASYRRAGARFVTLTSDREELHRRADAAGRPERWHREIDRWVARHGGGTPRSRVGW